MSIFQMAVALVCKDGLLVKAVFGMLNNGLPEILTATDIQILPKRLMMAA